MILLHSLNLELSLVYLPPKSDFCVTTILRFISARTKLKSVPGPGVKRSSVRLQLLMTGQNLGQNYVSSQVKGEKLLWNFPLSPNLLIEVFIENWDPEHYYYYQHCVQHLLRPSVGLCLVVSMANTQWALHLMKLHDPNEERSCSKQIICQTPLQQLL